MDIPLDTIQIQLIGQAGMIGWAFGFFSGSIAFILWSHVENDDNDRNL